jgi:hypothetical protein
LLALKKKPFQDGELLKEAFLTGAELLKVAFLTGADCISEGFSNKREIMLAIQDLQLSDITVTNLEDTSNLK